MKKHIILSSLFQLIAVLILFVFKNAELDYILPLSIISVLFFGLIQYLICRFVYKGSKSSKINMLLIMWDLLFCGLLALIFLGVEKKEAAPILIILLVARTELLIFSKKFGISGK